MFTTAGILIAAASGPFGDSLARTMPGQDKIQFIKRRRISDKAHAKKVCKVFQKLDKWYHFAPQQLHDMWNAYAKAPGISGYDAFMSQGLTATNQGWYVPDLPGEGNGSTPHPLMPGCSYPPPPDVETNPNAKCLVGQSRLDVRTSMYGQLQYRYRHSFRDPRFPNPADVDVVILGLWDATQNKYHLEIRGEVGVNLDTGWVDTYVPPHQLDHLALGNYKYFLLNQELDLPMNKPVAIPQQPAADDGDLVAFKAPFVDLHDGKVVPVDQFDSIYGQVRWQIHSIIQRAPYWWYCFTFTIALTARPNYQKQAGTVWIRAVFDKINQKWRLNLRGRLKKIVRDNRDPRFPWSKTMFRKIVRVSNPHVMKMAIQLTWKSDSITCRPRRGQYANFDTAKIPVWKK